MIKSLSFIMFVSLFFYSGMSMGRQPAQVANCSASAGESCIADYLWDKTRIWVDDWANHNVEGYLAAYLPKHSPVEGQSYEHWRAQRIKRVSHDADISLAINHLTTELLDNGEYKLLFIQRFSTKNYSDIVLKTLVFRQVGEHFYIANEQAHQSLTEETADYILWGIE